MLAACATLVFGSTFWLIAVLAARMLEESGARVISAVRAQPELRSPMPRVSRRGPSLPRQTEAWPQLRAAA